MRDNEWQFTIAGIDSPEKLADISSSILAVG